MKVYGPLEGESEIARINCQLRNFCSERAEFKFIPNVNTLERGLIYHETLDEIDFVHIGNSYAHHGHLLLYSLIKPCVLIMHDTNIRDLIIGSIGTDFFLNRLVQLLVLDYGFQSAKAISRAIYVNRGEDTLELLGSDAYELAVRSIMNASLAVIVHSPFEKSRLATSLNVPVFFVNLPHKIGLVDHLPHGDAVSIGEQKLKLLMFGHLGGNRCVKEVVKVVTQSAEGANLELTIAGTIASPDDMAVVQEAVNSGSVDYQGVVSDERLDELIKRCDISVNLRQPSMGEASSSQLRIFQFSKPSVVCDVGWYSSLPSDAVIKISRPDELQAAILSILDRKQEIVEMGRRGREYLCANHRFDTYLSLLGEVADEAKVLRSWALNRRASLRAQTMVFGSEQVASYALSRLQRGLNEMQGKTG